MGKRDDREREGKKERVEEGERGEGGRGVRGDERERWVCAEGLANMTKMIFWYIYVPVYI